MFADAASTGERDVKPTEDVLSAKLFDSFGAASDFSQNFGPDWTADSLSGGTDDEGEF